MLTIALAGATGRFGRAILTEIESSGNIQVVAAIATRTGLPVAGFPELRTASAWVDQAAVDVILDVSVPEGTMAALGHAVRTGTPFVTGVTGLTKSNHAELLRASTTIPVLATANFSIGVTALLSLLPQFAGALDGYDISIIDVHHRAKRDAPSGTARLIVDALNEGRSGDSSLDETVVTSIRTGGIPGQHSVSFVSMGEEIRIEHRALSRASFAEGAIAAVRWIGRQPSGLYSMVDVLT